MRVAVLSGGVGGSRFLKALCESLPQEDISAIVNTGDDLELFGLRICPDVDIVIYTLSGRVNPQTGWGLEGDTFSCLDELEALGEEAWFRLGDKDMAVQIWRANMLKNGYTLTQITRLMTKRFGLELNVIPMCDEFAPTMIQTPLGEQHFEHYLVRDKCQERVLAVHQGAAKLEAPCTQAIAAIQSAQLILFAPSNPFVSIATILAVKGIREAILASRAPKLGVSPILGSNVVKGPAARMLNDLGFPISSVGIAMQYAGLLDAFIIDTSDKALIPEISALGIRAHTADIMLDTQTRRKALVEEILRLSSFYVHSNK